MPTELQLETMRENGRKAAAVRRTNGFFSSENQSRRRKQQLENEQAAAERLRMAGFEVFSPTVVCDRIAAKDGKVFFVEFKRDGQELRPAQQQIRDSVPEMYMVVYE